MTKTLGENVPLFIDKCLNESSAMIAQEITLLYCVQRFENVSIAPT